MELNEYMRPLPPRKRKARLEKLLSRSGTGIVFNDHTDDDRAAAFKRACKMGLEVIVSKRLSATPSIRAVSELDQGEEPGQPGDGSSTGRRIVRRRLLRPFLLNLTY
jgi:hypothetical protein